MGEDIGLEEFLERFIENIGAKFESQQRMISRLRSELSALRKEIPSKKPSRNVMKVLRGE
ncbi:MAG: hypothetical protein JW754_06110 [Candidatus Aenigmarchaeota archaeon]|nr:hypothetical protein [Candidatus Aenigmarchaeota archaeon]